MADRAMVGRCRFVVLRNRCPAVYGLDRQPGRAVLVVRGVVRKANDGRQQHEGYDAGPPPPSGQRHQSESNRGHLGGQGHAYTAASMFPVSDVIPSRTRPVVTVALIVLTSVVFLYELQLDRAEMSGRWKLL